MSPNPVVALTDAEVSRCKALIAGAEKTSAKEMGAAFPPNRFYRGLQLKEVLRENDGSRTIRSITRVLGANILESSSDSVTWFNDNSAAVERLLLDLALEKRVISRTLYNDIQTAIKSP